MIEDLAERKRALRAVAKARRRDAHGRLGDAAGALVRDHFLGSVPVTAGATVAGYWPFGHELDAAPLLRHLYDRGHPCALPAVERTEGPLVFRAWRPGDALGRGGFGEPLPLADAAVLIPGLVLAPLLAFDRQGYRLGYGGGYYDRTIARLRSAGKVTAVGLAYSAQEFERVPHDGQDQRLDWIVTESGAIRVE